LTSDAVGTGRAGPRRERLFVARPALPDPRQRHCRVVIALVEMNEPKTNECHGRERSTPKRRHAIKAMKAVVSLDDLDQASRRRRSICFRRRRNLKSRATSTPELFDRSPIAIYPHRQRPDHADQFCGGNFAWAPPAKVSRASISTGCPRPERAGKLLAHLRHCRDDEINVTTSWFLKSGEGPADPGGI